MRRDEIKYNHEQPLKKTGLSLLRSTLCYYYYYYTLYRMCSRLYCFHYILYYIIRLHVYIYVYNNVHTKINVYRYVLSEKTCNP